MPNKLSRFFTLHGVGLFRGGAYRATYLFLSLVRARLFAFILIAFFISFAFSVQGKNQSANAHRQIERHAFQECTELNRGIAASNNRIKVVLKASKLIEFRTEADRQEFAAVLTVAAAPTPLAKCHKPG